MAKELYKVIRDPVHNIIQFPDTLTDRLLLDLINSREFQRLRRVKQLGFSEIVFPGANHSRLAHSIGVMHVARMFLDRIGVLVADKLSERHRTVVLVAALLHDVGHGPFSHAFEKITKENHENRTREIVQSPETEVNKILTAFSAALPGEVAAFFQKDATQADGPGFLTHIVTSQFDADRSDYLLRDSHATGTDYGRIDLRWLIDHLMVDSKDRFLYLGRKAFFGVEQYVFARYHMYQTVYFHKATRAAEVMLRLLFQRYKQLVQSASNNNDKRSIVPEAPPAVLGAFTGQLSLADYLQLDDHTMSEFFKRCELSSDGILRTLASGILHRRLYKCIDATGMPAQEVAEFAERAKELARAKKYDPAYTFASDSPADTPYKVYDPVAEHPATQIYVEQSPGRIIAINDASDQVAVLRKQITSLRYYFPAALREDVARLRK